MDEIGQRLRECADACVAAYAVWAEARKDVAVREKLQEAVHELRKVSARLEIEMALSERQEMAQRPIPVPPHRSSRRRDPEHFPVDDDEGGNGLPGFITDGNGNHDEQQPPRHTAPQRHVRTGGSGGSGGSSSGSVGGPRRMSGRPAQRTGGAGGSSVGSSGGSSAPRPVRPTDVTPSDQE